MRLFPLALLLMFAPIAFSQDAPPPTEPVEPKDAPDVEEKKVDPWAVERPESAPEGEPIALKISMDPAIEHHMVTEVTQNMNLMGQPTEIKNKMAVQLKLASNEAGGASFTMPIDLQSITVRGMDQTPMAKQQMTDPKFTGKFDSNGDVVAGSVKGIGMPPSIAAMLNSSVNGVFSFSGARTVRKGEVWEMDAARFAPRVNGTEGGTITGNVYMKLRDIKDVDGVQCADLVGVFAITIKGATVHTQMGAMPADLKIKGECEEICGLDGVVRSRVVNSKIEMTIQGTPVGVTAATKVTGGPQKAASKPADGEKPAEAAADEKPGGDEVGRGKEDEHEIEEGCGE